MKLVFNAIFFEPLYNLLVWLVGVLPGHGVGLAVIVLTVLVRLILFPLQHRMSRTQSALRELAPTITELKNKYQDNRSEQARQLMLLYRAHGINPFAGFVSLFIQLPILIALFLVFRRGFDFQAETLYSFIAPPATVGVIWLGIDLTVASLVLAVLAGLTQFIQSYLIQPKVEPKAGAGSQSFSTDFQRSLSLQMRYVMPIMIVFIAAKLPAAIALYWITGNLFSVVHEYSIKTAFKSKRP